MKKHLLLCSLLLIGFLGIAQQDDAYKNFINKTTLCVYKAKKELLSHQKTDVGGFLAKAFILQINAISLYKKDKNNAQNLCSSILARNYAVKIILDINGTIGSGYTTSDEEKKLFVNCEGESVLYNQCKIANPNLPETDKDYIFSSDNNINLDLN